MQRSVELANVALELLPFPRKVGLLGVTADFDDRRVTEVCRRGCQLAHLALNEAFPLELSKR
jgi:hypothetical protein